jgi:hypothetical protein
MPDRAADFSEGFENGVSFVPLASLRETNMVLTTVAEAVGLPPQDESVLRFVRGGRFLSWTTSSTWTASLRARSCG